MSAANVDFGFTPVREDEKQARVNDVFASVASRYDVMNDLMSAGLHHVWKDRLIDQLRPHKNMHLLDLAGGTGDVGFRFLKRGGGPLTLSDINPAMLAEGKRRAMDQNLYDRIHWQEANAEALPFETQCFDAVTMAFGIRNVTHIDRVLSESLRVLKSGGHFLCLEFSHPTLPLLQKLYDAYSFRVIPEMGRLVTGDVASYQYLVESIRRFPTATRFEAMLKEAGFTHTRHQLLTGGVVAIHSGWKI
ncbi:MAG: bifunctional demethylmenaquinone methyltransferase/2-methoxy-6-polyprenyl-1,4-benzoquinol methylase UbiE [Rickettsiales bacterium]|nr:bifunctional demethylmenaquinone methyltransferase/2-methoxy-6-polyprenyl-1,4-benzoquinol methylase UbiE [Rickettsiales bacterium]